MTKVEWYNRGRKLDTSRRPRQQTLWVIHRCPRPWTGQKRDDGWQRSGGYVLEDMLGRCHWNLFCADLAELGPRRKTWDDFSPHKVFWDFNILKLIHGPCPEEPEGMIPWRSTLIRGPAQASIDKASGNRSTMVKAPRQAWDCPIVQFSSYYSKAGGGGGRNSVWVRRWRVSDDLWNWGWGGERNYL